MKDVADSPFPVADAPAFVADAPVADAPVDEVPPAAGPVTTFSDGTHRVGVDIAPGTYLSSGGDFCYWERQSRIGSGELDDIIANEISMDGGQVVVTIDATDEGFKTSDCGVWTPA